MKHLTGAEQAGEAPPVPPVPMDLCTEGGARKDASNVKNLKTGFGHRLVMFERRRECGNFEHRCCLGPEKGQQKASGGKELRFRDQSFGSSR